MQEIGGACLKTEGKMDSLSNQAAMYSSDEYKKEMTKKEFAREYIQPIEKKIKEVISSCEKRIVKLENDSIKYDINNPMMIMIQTRIEEINLQIENLKSLLR